MKTDYETYIKLRRSGFSHNDAIELIVAWTGFRVDEIRNAIDYWSYWGTTVNDSTHRP